MADRPLLFLPPPREPAPRKKKGSGGARVSTPSRERQGARLTARFQALEEALNQRRTRLSVDAHGLAPEEVVVLQVVGTVTDFIRAVDRMPGMEWLTEVEESDIPPDDDFFALTKDDERRPGVGLSGRLFMVFANQAALTQLLSLWKSWQQGEALPRGLGRWQSVFAQLRDVRPWGVEDRLIDTGVLLDWRERLEFGEENVPCEIELWFRRTSEQRRVAHDRVSKLVQDLSGHVLSEATVTAIGYHAVLADLPIGAIQSLLDAPSDTALVQCEQIQFFRASGQMAGGLSDGPKATDTAPLQEAESLGAPVLALFDGLPIQRHRRLEGRVVVDDPDDLEEHYPAVARRHGTAMASLIVHGDLNAGDKPLTRRLYIRPILEPDRRSWRNTDESLPEDVLTVDLLHRAVRRLFEGDSGEAAAAPEVAVINLSIGIRDRPFDHALSPLARLLDWLAWRYQVLFVVSAGNYGHDIDLKVPRGTLASPDANLKDLLIRAVASQARHRRLLSPSEAVNVITVGSIHEDASTDAPPPRWHDPYPSSSGLPSPINAQGQGYRRAVKPELLAPGGRVVAQRSLATGATDTLEIYRGTLAPGQLAAAPGTTPGVRDSCCYVRGTSNAAALVTRGAGKLAEVLEELREEPGGEVIDQVPRAVWLKALLSHGADWGDAGETMKRILRTPDNSRKFKEYVTRLLGYGTINVERVSECTRHRVTALTGGSLKQDLSHVHRFPLPPSLSGRVGLRRLIVTLAWLTPVNPRHHNWRRADLYFSPPQDPLGVKRKQADWLAVQRGTLQHEILEGERATAYVAGTDLEIQVSCRADAGALDDEVPYALVTTLEVATDVGVTIYEEVRAALRARVRVAQST